MIIREVEKPSLRDLLVLPGRAKTKNSVLNDIRLTGSGKGAIALVLNYLCQKKIITDKLDEVMVPDWVGHWVYNQIHPFAFPSKRFSERTRAILVYHQYGFPQNMDKIMEFASDKKLIVIEDCAHALCSRYKGRPLGTFGDFTIYSFSKWFFCFALGGVSSRYEDFHRFVKKAASEVPFGLTLLKDSAKFLSEWSIFSRNAGFKRYANLFLSMSYSLYGEALRPSRLARRLLLSKISREIAVRQKRYLYFLDRTSHLGICDHLEREGVTPYVIPICCKKRKNEMLVNALKQKNVVTGLYHFDLNRNFLFPKFAQCVWIPCHGGISDDMFTEITELIVKKLG